MIPERAVPNYWKKVEVRGPDECWPWLASCGSHGYGQIGWQIGDGSHRITMVLAHRVAWFLANGAIPDGLTIDHKCRNRICQNPAHLRLMTNEENGRRNGNWIKTHCKYGHEFSEENTFVNPKGHRYCITCRRTIYNKRRF